MLLEILTKEQQIHAVLSAWQVLGFYEAYYNA